MPANSGHSSARGRSGSKGREAHTRPRPGTCPVDPALEPWAGLHAALASPLPERVLRTPPSGGALPRRRPSLMGGRRAVSRTSLTPRPRAPTPQLSGPHPFCLLLLWGPLLMPLVSQGGSGGPALLLMFMANTCSLCWFREACLSSVVSLLPIPALQDPHHYRHEPLPQGRTPETLWLP